MNISQSEELIFIPFERGTNELDEKNKTENAVHSYAEVGLYFAEIESPALKLWNILDIAKSGS